MYAKKKYKPMYGNGGKDTEMIMKMQEGGRMRKRRVATMQELRPISPRLITQREYYNPLPEDDYRNDPYFRRPRMAFDAEQYSGRAGYGKTAAEKEANIDRKIIDENRSMLLSGRGLEPMMYLVDKYMKGGTVKYRSGGMMEYENGGIVKKYQNGGTEDNTPDVRVVSKDTYLTSDEPQAGQDYIIMVDGKPTDYRKEDMPNFYRSYGIDGKQLDTVYGEFLNQFPLASRDEAGERSFRKAQFNKVLADVGAIARGDAGEVKTVTPGAFSKDELGNMLRSVVRGGEATRSREFEGRYSPTGQKGTPKNVNADEFLRALAENYRN